MLKKILFDILDFSRFGATLYVSIILITSAPSQDNNIEKALCIFLGFNILYYMYESEKQRILNEM